jgi:hypothetical protein
MIGPKNAISVILIQDSIDARTSCPAVEKRILCEFAMRSNAESEVRHRLDAILSLDLLCRHSFRSQAITVAAGLFP